MNNSTAFAVSKKLDGHNNQKLELLLSSILEKMGEQVPLVTILERFRGESLKLERLKNVISLLVMSLDDLMTKQVNRIIHHRQFQQMEASWRSLYHLCAQAEDKNDVKIKLLDVTLRELSKDFDKAIEFDQSQLFKKVYSNEYDTAGGEPFGVLLGNYNFSHVSSQEQPFDSLSVLSEISHVAAASFSPFISSVDPSIFGLESFSGIAQQIDFESSFKQPEYFKWSAFRQNIDSRFVGLVLPRVLIRRTYGSSLSRNDGFGFYQESVSNVDDLLWGNPCFAFGSVLMRAFNRNGWFADIRGSSQGVDDGGVAPDLITDYFGTDSQYTALKFATDVVITETKERVLSDLGFIPLCHSRGTRHAVFYGNQSVKGISDNTSKEEELNEKLSSMLQYIFCVSRFAHYLKTIGRDKIGTFSDASECEEYLHKWLMGYTVSSQTGSIEMRARYPLSECSVEVREIVGKSGVFGCIIHLKPHMQLDQIMSSIKLVTQLGTATV